LLQMRLPIHAGYEVEPTKAVAVPIYQTVAYAFDSAAHGAALFNLEVEGYRCRRIANPTCDVLERRVAALEGGLEALSVSSGQAALHCSVLKSHREGQEHRLGAAALWHHLFPLRPHFAGVRDQWHAAGQPAGNLRAARCSPDNSGFEN